VEGDAVDDPLDVVVGDCCVPAAELAGASTARYPTMASDAAAPSPRAAALIRRACRSAGIM